MIFAAKYPGKCAICGESFPAGTQIDWRKGEPSRHATCLQKPAEQDPAPAPATQAPQSSGGKASAGHTPSAPRQIRSIDF